LFFVFFLVVFLAVISLKFPIEIFLVTYARETLVNEWDAKWTKRSEEVYSLGWVGQEENIMALVLKNIYKIKSQHGKRGGKFVYIMVSKKRHSYGGNYLIITS
jgi:hypothetical protein